MTSFGDPLANFRHILFPDEERPRTYAEELVLNTFPMNIFNYNTDEESQDDTHLYIGPMPGEFQFEDVVETLIYKR
jgi:hypothetical protein